MEQIPPRFLDKIKSELRLKKVLTKDKQKLKAVDFGKILVQKVFSYSISCRTVHWDSCPFDKARILGDGQEGTFSRKGIETSRSMRGNTNCNVSPSKTKRNEILHAFIQPDNHQESHRFKSAPLSHSRKVTFGDTAVASRTTIRLHGSIPTSSSFHGTCLHHTPAFRLALHFYSSHRPLRFRTLGHNTWPVVAENRSRTQCRTGNNQI